MILSFNIGDEGNVTFFREESNKEPVCDVKVSWLKLEGGTAAPWQEKA